MQPPRPSAAQMAPELDMAIANQMMNGIRELCARIIYVLEYRRPACGYNASLVPLLERLIHQINTYEIAIEGSTDATIERVLRSIQGNCYTTADIWDEYWNNLNASSAAAPEVAIRFQVGQIITHMLQRCAFGIGRSVVRNALHEH